VVVVVVSCAMTAELTTPMHTITVAIIFFMTKGF